MRRAAAVEGDDLLGGGLRPVAEGAQPFGGQAGLVERGGDVGGGDGVDGQAGDVVTLVLQPDQGAEQRRARVVDEGGRTRQHVGGAGQHVGDDAGEQPALDRPRVGLDDGRGLRLVVVVEPRRGDARLLLAGGRDVVDQIVRADDSDDDTHPRLLLLITV